MFSKILIANRGEIACRVIETARTMGIKTVAVYSDSDACARHVLMADESVHIGPSPASESYLRGDVIIDAALSSGADAIHPGYGFLSENPEFVELVEDAGLVFIGPSAASIRAMGLKDAAKELMSEAGVPVVPGYHGSSQDAAFLQAEADKIGYPVLIKARAGGGGKGLRLVERSEDFAAMQESAAREGQSSFGDSAVLVEKFIKSPRHIEVQIFGDGHGNVVHMFERDCSLQRRHQKVIEEAPAPGMTAAVRKAMTGAAIAAAKSINYEGAGTVEFIVDGAGALRVDGFWFMEMNTRLQVEHPVTEAIIGMDLVELQIRVAAGEALPFTQDELKIEGHAFEARVYAEDVQSGFLPATGRLAHVEFSSRARIDSGVRSGDTITPFYDPMISKIITHAQTRASALDELKSALSETHVAGTATNIDFLTALTKNLEFSIGDVDTGLIERNFDTLTYKRQTPPLALAFASLAMMDIDPSDPMVGWRVWGSARHAIKLQIDGAYSEYKVVLDGAGEVDLLDAEGQLILRLSGVSRHGSLLCAELNNIRQSAKAAVFWTGGDKHVSIHFEGSAYACVQTDPLAVVENPDRNTNEVSAPMTGIVQAIHAEIGAVVEKGTRLLVIEAMKMEMVLEAPRNGVVESIHCDAGSTVEGGSVLVTFESGTA